jgi:magnesium-transporting ATPase (P-type)
LIARRFVELEYYMGWAERYKTAAASTVNRDKKMDELADEIEVDLELVGCTAIEDKL